MNATADEATLRRFWSKVNKTDSCWEWTGNLVGAGYGRVCRDGVMLLAHRVVWEMVNGPIPGGMEVMHKCDNPPCGNPVHLTHGTNADNLADMAQKGRARGGRRTKDGQEPVNRR